jgi:uncharacterized protein (DUF2062 family)
MSERPISSSGARPGFRDALRNAVSRLRGGQVSPQKIGFSVAFGIFIGCTPLFGLHALIIGLLGFALRLDVLVAYLASNVSLPPFIPAILFLEVQAGSWILGGRFLPLTMASFAPERALALGGALALGTVVVGAAFAAVGGSVAWLLMHRFQASRGSELSPESIPPA